MSWFEQRWMLLGITMARWFPFLHKAKMQVGDSMVLACTLTMPSQPDMQPWPDGRMPLLVMFRPPKGSSGGVLFAAEMRPDGSRPGKADFTKSDLGPMPMYGGAAYVFVTDNFDRPTAYFVRCVRDGTIVDSGIVLSKIDRGPTLYDAEMVKVEASRPPVLSWPEPTNADHWIHFVIVADEMKLLAGIYVRKCSWMYGAFSDLPYYIHDPMNTPQLSPGNDYQFFYSAVDSDAWVTTASMGMFRI